MAFFGSLQSVRGHFPADRKFAVALTYLDELMAPDSVVQRRVRGLSTGDSEKIPLSEGLFVIEQAYETKLRADGFFESHRNYIDIQTVFEGEELMEVADLARMTVRQPYHAERDLIVYEDSSDASLLRVHSGQVALFFPADVHMPSLRIRKDAVLVRKCVIKVPVA